MKRVLLSILVSFFAFSGANAEFLVLINETYIDQVEIMANQSGEIVFQRGEKYYQINNEKIQKAQESIPEAGQPLDSEALSSYEVSLEALSSAPEEESEDPEGEELDTGSEDPTPQGVTRLDPGNIVKIYFYNGRSVKGMLESWGKEEIILQQEDKEYIIEVGAVKDAKYYISSEYLSDQTPINFDPPQPVKILTEEEKAELEKTEKIQALTRKMNAHQLTRKTEYVFGTLFLLLGGGVFFEAEINRDTRGRIEQNLDVQALIGLAGVFIGTTIVSAGVGQSRIIELLEEKKQTLSLKPEVKQDYQGLKLSFYYSTGKVKR